MDPPLSGAALTSRNSCDIFGSHLPRGGAVHGTADECPRHRHREAGVSPRAWMTRGTWYSGSLSSGVSCCTLSPRCLRPSRAWKRVDVRLIAPQIVKASVQSPKRDARDADAICEALTRPIMRVAPVKQVVQQDLQTLHRVLERLIRTRTALVNESRRLLSEYGIVLPQGMRKCRTDEDRRFLPQLCPLIHGSTFPVRLLREPQYGWEPDLLGLENEPRGDEEVGPARFPGGALVSAGYAQQTGAPHVLAPRRSRLIAAQGIRAGEIQFALGGHGPDSREMITRPPLPQDGRVPRRGVYTDDTSQGVEQPGFIDEADGLLLGLGPF
jgi:hypothetical protein